MDTKLLGRWGEALAAEYLKKKKFTLVGAGYRTRTGEIDLIAEDRKFVVFAEVKLRNGTFSAAPAEFVDKNKQRRIISAAQAWLAAHGTDKQPRFDVIEIYAPDGMKTEKPVINHIENAFGEDY